MEQPKRSRTPTLKQSTELLLDLKMRFAPLFAALCLAGSTTASPIETAAQDVTLITACITRASSGLIALDKAMQSRPKGGSTAEAQQITQDLMALAQATTEDVRTCGRDIRRNQKDISTLEGLTLLTPFNALATQLQKVSDEWISSKPMVVAAGLRESVLMMLMDTSEAVIVFSDALIAKFSYLEQPVGMSYKTTFSSIIEKCIAEYRKP